MPEKILPAVVFECEDCERGELVFTGKRYVEGEAATYEHVCTKCKVTVHLLKRYPFIQKEES